MKSRTLEEQVEQDASEVIRHAVSGMLPKNKLHSDRMNRLKIYNDDQHQHAAQKPTKIGVNNGK